MGNGTAGTVWVGCSMADTVLTVEWRIRELIGDVTSGDFAVSVPALRQMIKASLQIAGAKLGLSNAWVPSAVTLATGTSDYILPSGAQISNLLGLFRNTDGIELEYRSLSTIMAGRHGTVAPTGPPEAYTAWEDASQLANIRLDKNPAAANNGQTLNAFRSVLPAELSSDSTSIPLSRVGLAAIEMMTAASALATMTENGVAKLGRSKDVVPLWNQQGMVALEAEASRLYALQFSGRFKRFSSVVVGW